MQKLNLEIQYVKGNFSTVAHSLSCRALVTTMSSNKNIMLDNIKEFYGENVFFYYPFENLSKWICIPNTGGS